MSATGSRDAKGAQLREARIRREIERRRLALVPFGLGWRVCGPGVDVLCTELSLLHVEDLEPSRSMREG